MIDLQKLRALQIKKDLVAITLIEKKQLKTKTYVFIGIFVLAALIMGILQTAHSNSQITDLGLMAGKGILKFAGIFFWAGIILIFRVSSLNKEIKTLDQEVQQLNLEILHMSN